MENYHEVKLIVHIGNTKISYTIIIPKNTFCSLLKKVLAEQFKVNENRISIRCECYNIYPYNNYNNNSNTMYYNEVDSSEKIDGVFINIYYFQIE